MNRWAVDPWVVALDYRLRPVAPLTPYFDKSFQIDMKTGLYLAYKEFTPGSVVQPPDQFLGRRFYDVLTPRVADAMDRAIFKAQRQQRDAAFDARVFNHWVSCRVQAHDYAQIDCIVIRRSA